MEIAIKNDGFIQWVFWWLVGLLGCWLGYWLESWKCWKGGKDGKLEWLKFLRVGLREGGRGCGLS